MAKVIEHVHATWTKLTILVDAPIVRAYVTLFIYHAAFAVAIVASLTAYSGEILGDDTAPPDAGPTRAEVSEALHREDSDPLWIFDGLPILPTPERLINI